MTTSNAEVETKDSGLTETEEKEHEFRLDRKMMKAIKDILAGLPIKGFEQFLGKDFWLREILTDVYHDNPNIRSRALMMLGQFLGILSERKGMGGKKRVSIEEEPQ